MGKETISGEFTGCVMAIYNDGGTTRVCHVDSRQGGARDAPSKTRWAQTRARQASEKLRALWFLTDSRRT
jgi:hypothetical protein